MTETALYRHFDAEGRLLYVGISLSAIQRLSQHLASAWAKDIRNVTVEILPTREDALAAEATAIREEQPLHNRCGKVDMPINLLEGAEEVTLSVFMQQHGLTQARLAREIGISRSYLAEILKGVKVPGRNAIAKIATATGGKVPASVWFSDETEVV